MRRLLLLTSLLRLLLLRAFFCVCILLFSPVALAMDPPSFAGYTYRSVRCTTTASQHQHQQQQQQSLTGQQPLQARVRERLRVTAGADLALTALSATAVTVEFLLSVYSPLPHSRSQSKLLLVHSGPLSHSRIVVCAFGTPLSHSRRHEQAQHAGIRQGTRALCRIVVSAFGFTLPTFHSQPNLHSHSHWHCCCLCIRLGNFPTLKQTRALSRIVVSAFGSTHPNRTLSGIVAFFLHTAPLSLSGTNESAAYTGVPAPTLAQAQYAGSHSHSLSLPLWLLLLFFCFLFSLFVFLSL